jgi:hypothetical protein
MIEVLGRYSNSIDEITIEMDDKNISSKECLCALSSALQQKKYDFVFVVSPETLSFKELAKIKKLQVNAQFILYMWDSFENKNSFLIK